MFSFIQKYWPFVSLILISLLLASLFFWPALSSPLGMIVLVLAVGIAIIFTVRRHWNAYKNDELTRTQLTRNIAVDVLGIFITISIISFLGGLVGQYVGFLAGNAAEVRWPEVGAGVGIIAAILSAFVIGFGVRLLMGWTWGRLSISARPG